MGRVIVLASFSFGVLMGMSMLMMTGDDGGYIKMKGDWCVITIFNFEVHC